MWDIRIAVFLLLCFFVRLVCPKLIEEQLLLGVIFELFWKIPKIEVLFASTYKTTAKIDRESAG